MKKILSVITVICLLLSAAVIPVSASGSASYPFILVHGMMGWGENAEGQHENPYWGYSQENDIVKYLRSEGVEAYAPTMGGMSSAWDRACELYAQLAGTVVDYGAAHSAKAGHARYGRDYTDRPIMGRAWDLSEKINLVSHSFGGPTVSIFTYLLANGAQEEIAAAPEDCSELFKGGHADAVFSVTTLESPHNGSTIANLLYDTKLPVYMVAFIINVMGTQANPAIDFMMDQWGVTADPATGETAKFDPAAIIKLAKSNDHCAYDMSLQGAKELEKYTAVDSVYYFSYAADCTEKGALGLTVMNEQAGKSILGFSGRIIIMLAGHTYGGVKTDKSWAANDGMVPVPSALYPNNAENNHTDYAQEGMAVEPGIWYVMPVVQGGTHGFGISGKEVLSFWDTLTDRINNI